MPSEQSFKKNVPNSTVWGALIQEAEESGAPVDVSRVGDPGLLPVILVPFLVPRRHSWGLLEELGAQFDISVWKALPGQPQKRH